MPIADQLRCDLAVCYEVKLYLATCMSRLAEGEVLEFISPDPQAERELYEWTALRGYDLLDVQRLDDQQTRFLIRR